LEYLDATTVGVGDNLSLTVKNNNGTVENTITVSDPFSYYTVSGTFTVTQQGVDRGYVIFEYNLTGLPTYSEFTFSINNLTVAKKESS
jgi:hypothetical protein